MTITFIETSLNGHICLRKTAPIDPQTLATRWMISPEHAKQTVVMTTQRGVQTCLNPTLSRWFPTNDWLFQYKRVLHTMFSNMLFAGSVCYNCQPLGKSVHMYWLAKWLATVAKVTFSGRWFSSICSSPLTIASQAYVGTSNVLSYIRLALVATGQAWDLNRRPKYLCYNCRPLGQSVHPHLFGSH